MTLPSSIAEALRLTRAGDLTRATALLGASLRGQALPTIELPAVNTARPAIADPRPASPAGSFEARRHSGPSGRIEYMLYRPAAAAPGMPLVVMLHGCTQSPEDFARGTAMNRLAEQLGFLVAYPRQTQAANAQKCWNWFRPGDQQRDRGEPALIAGLTRDVMAAEGVDPARIYIAGLSAGGAAAAVMADAYPDLYAAVGIHSGLACGSARDLPSALGAMKRGGGSGTKSRATARFVPVITFHGDRDGTVNEANAREIVAAATAAAGVPIMASVETGDAGGRRYTRAQSRDPSGRVLIEQWTIAGAGHAWSGGDPAGSYADAAGPDASRFMLEFFLSQSSSSAASPPARQVPNT